MPVVYKSDLTNIDWIAMKAILNQDSFDNGRTPAQLEKSFQNSFATCIALDNEKIVGTARALSDGVCNAYVVDVWTLSTYRRRGIGRTMMEKLIQPFYGQHVYLVTDDAIDFYRKLGFKERPTGMEKIIGTWLKNE